MTARSTAAPTASTTFAARMGGLPARLVVNLPEGALTEQLPNATVLFSGIRHFTSLAEKLDSGEVAALLTEYLERACQAVLNNGGRNVRLVGDGLMAVFTDTDHVEPLPAARRAVSAALDMAMAAHVFRDWLDERYRERGLPPFAIGVGLHSGEVTLCQLGAVQNMETAPIGDTVNTAARLEAASQAHGWTVVASAEVLLQAGDGILTGVCSSLAMHGKAPVEMHEVTGLAATEPDRAHGLASPAERAQEIRHAVKANSAIAARAIKSARDARLATLKAQGFEPVSAAIQIQPKGYRITRKIGAGGMAEVYLAQRESDGRQVVLKILDSRGTQAPQRLAAFLQEFSMLSGIEHPHVIRIYEQGFTGERAYIAMEYFERGDLRGLFGPQMTEQRALAVVRETALALQEIHARGIVHCDIKPENIMLRADGTTALADFGAARSLRTAENLDRTPTPHGWKVGTPYYLSPEQAGGKPITPQSDLYSLGVMMFEMLAGKRPFIAESLELLLAKHLHADTPALPAAQAHLQAIVNQLMQKDVTLRYPSAPALLAALEQIAGPGQTETGQTDSSRSERP